MTYLLTLLILLFPVSVQAQFGTQPAGTVFSQTMTAGFAVYTADTNVLIASQTVTAQELGYLNGVTSPIQAQIELRVWRL